MKGKRPETEEAPHSEISEQFLRRFAGSASAIKDFQEALKQQGEDYTLLPYDELMHEFKLKDLVH